MLKEYIPKTQRDTTKIEAKDIAKVQFVRPKGRYENNKSEPNQML